jgi:hypothetical protein
MNEKDLKMFEAHAGNPVECKIYNPVTKEHDVMKFEALGSKHLGKFMYVADKMPKKQKGETDEAFAQRMADLSESDYEVFASLVDLIKLMVLQSYPDVPADMLDKFVFKNFGMLFVFFQELHKTETPDMKDAQTIQDFIASRKGNAPSNPAQ